MAAALVALLAWIVLALNAGFAAESGIECGWQPMPDGSASYECVIQVSPELVNSLQRGDSIPLTIDVPEHIRPISRIRLVAGSEIVPRQILAQHLKPWPANEKKSRDGIVETQFTSNNFDPRYTSQQAINGAVVPVNEYMANAQDAVNRQLQNGSQAVQNAVGQITQDVLPPNAGQSVTDAINNAGQELSNNLRSTSDSVQNDIRQMFGSTPAPSGNSVIMPPSSQPLAVSNNQQPPVIMPDNANNAANNTRRLDQPIPTTQTNNWQSTQPVTSPLSGNNVTSPTNNFNTQSANRYGNAPSFAGNGATVLSQSPTPQAPNQTDRYFGAGQTASADSRNGTLANSQPVSSGPSFPAFTPTLGNEQSTITPTPMTSSSAPEIRREMLNQPANAAIQGANGLPIGQQPISQAPTTVQAPPVQSPLAGNNFNWETKPHTQQISTPQLSLPTNTATTSVFPLLLSWVLLSGSGAGNLYLFWSYLDVRTKYHDLVDDASRRISGRRVRD
jgi:hypothetical protein